MEQLSKLQIRIDIAIWHLAHVVKLLQGDLKDLRFINHGGLISSDIKQLILLQIPRASAKSAYLKWPNRISNCADQIT